MGGARSIAALATIVLVTACASASGGADDSIDWYVEPSAVDASALAQACAPTGARVRVHTLPADPDERHTELVRTMQADPDAVDLLTLESTAVPELEASDLVRSATPWLVDPQLLWYRGILAERAGIDVTQPVGWGDLIDGAQRLGVSVQVADTGGAAGWAVDLIAASGGAVISGEGSDATVGLDTDAGRAAVSLMQAYLDANVGPGPSDTAVEEFLGARGGFLVAPASTFAEADVRANIDQLGATAYPVLAEPAAPGTTWTLVQTTSSTDTGGVLECLTSPETLTQIASATGVGPPDPEFYADESLAESLPTAEAVGAAVEALVPAPETPYWNLVRRAIESTWSPLSSLSIDATPRDSQAAVEAALRGELP